ncbi:hypothetical protein [Rhizorhabdus sp.]|uniref:hypothetical protein n=1 Tax=Rhizorhabdus sp. TaxID=1968843 RepID=UPI001988CE60|nr:hypothetical protein [Rhizorhabdus sp.]MBD3761485.1 transglutaminase-like cysteine peptidase [Rhizorhabdus sp.]
MNRLRLAGALLLLALASPAYAHSRLDTLEDVNWRVNGFPLTDCRAFAFEKGRRLARLGIPSDLVITQTKDGTPHLIVVVDKKWALDNLQTRVVTIDQLRAAGYFIASGGWVPSSVPPR